MKQLTIYQENHNGSTIIPNVFIDEYMQDANDAQIKIYLYLIRIISAHKSTDISDMADKFNYTEKDVMRALKYWEKCGLLSLEYNDSKHLTAIHLKETVKKSAPLPDNPIESVIELPGSALKPEDNAEKVQPPSDAAAKPAYTLDQLKAFKDNEEISQLLFVVEQYIGKTLSAAEIRIILYLYDSLHFSVDLIDYLIQYCVDRGKKSFRYIEKVALNWNTEGITTPKEAARHARKHDKVVYQVMDALGKNTSPTNPEIAFINRWIKEYCFSHDIIFEACARTVKNTDKHRFEYAESILASWYKHNVHHLADIQKVDESFVRTKNNASPPKQAVYNNKFNQFKQNSYDFDELEKELLSN